jgi:transposase
LAILNGVCLYTEELTMNTSPPTDPNTRDASENEDKARIVALENETRELKLDLKKSQDRLQEALGIIDQLQRKLFGRSSEKMAETLTENEQPLIGFEAAYIDSQLNAANASDSTATPGETPEEASAAQTAAPANAPPPKTRKPYTPRRSLILAGLRTEEHIIIPAQVQEHPENFRYIGQEITETLERSRAEFYVSRYIRNKYVPIDPESLAAAKDGDTAATAPIIATLPTLFEHSYASPSALSYIAVSHYMDHLPYYRIETMFKRDGIYLPRAQMCRWIGQLVETYLQPIVQAILDQVFMCRILMMDETPVSYLPPKQITAAKTQSEPGASPPPDPPQAPPPKDLDEIQQELQKIADELAAPVGRVKTTKKGYLWVIHTPGVGTYYHWSTSRAHTVPNELIPEGWKGHIICDDYAAYRTVANLRASDPAKYGGITLGACMAHVRRKFTDAQSQAPKESTHVLKEIQKLYAIEANLREQKATAETVLATRKAESQPIFDTLKVYLEGLKSSPADLPRSSLGKAVRYALNQWPEFQPYLTDGEIPLDNNATERAIRPTAVGKKNWLFFGTAESGKTSAAMYTLIETAKMHDVEPESYLKALFTALPEMKMKDASDWTPKAYAVRQAEKKAAATVKSEQSERSEQSEQSEPSPQAAA